MSLVIHLSVEIGYGLLRRTMRPRTIASPAVRQPCLRACELMSHPAAASAGVMSLVQMSRSDRSFLFTVYSSAGRHGTADRDAWRVITTRRSHRWEISRDDSGDSGPGHR